MQRIEDIILNSTENDYIDFKQQWYEKKDKDKMLHDILCLSNSVSDSTYRYLIIGIKENSKTKEKIYHDVANDNNVLKAEDIIQIMRNVMSVIPKIEISRLEINHSYVDIIKIEPKCRDLPYVLSKNFNRMQKNFVYSRNSSQNTPISESCEKEILKELFARQRGEHLSVIEKFEMYLNDMHNWKLAIGENINNYYYNDNYKFRIVKRNSNENIRYFKNIHDYHEILVDTGINVAYWNEKYLNYDDYYDWFNVELWAENTLINTYPIMYFYAKHFFVDRDIYTDSYYLPPRDILGEEHLKNKKSIEKSFIWKICQVLFYCDLASDYPFVHYNSSKILDFLNYDFIQDPSDYIEKNQEWIYK